MRNDKISILIKKIALSTDKFAGQILAPYELSNTQYKIIKYLYSQPNARIRQTDIENNFSLTNPTVTGILQNLEKKGLIRRIQNPEDKRSKLLHLTDAALAMREELYRIGDTIEASVVSNLTKEECAELLRLLHKIEQKEETI